MYTHPRSKTKVDRYLMNWIGRVGYLKIHVGEGKS